MGWLVEVALDCCVELRVVLDNVLQSEQQKIEHPTTQDSPAYE